MKRATCVLLAACSMAIAAEEPRQPAAQPSPSDQLAVPPLPEGLQWLYPDGNFKLQDRWRSAAASGRFFISRGSGACYFINTVRPVPADADAPRTGFIKLQARSSGFVREPVCTGDATLMRATPVARKVAATAGGDQGRQD